MVNAAEIAEQIAGQLLQATELSAVADELSAALATLRGVGQSDDDTVQVTVDHHGIPLNIEVRPHALEYTANEVGAMVVLATERAISDVQAQAEPIRDALLPPHLTKPMRTDLSDQLDALLDIADAIDDERSGRPQKRHDS